MTLEDATWPAVVFTLGSALMKWASKAIDKILAQRLATEETRRERIEAGTKLIETLHDDLAELRHEVQRLNDRLDRPSDG